MQGTAAVVLAAAFWPPSARPGPGCATSASSSTAPAPPGSGSPTSCATPWSATGLSHEEATRRFWCAGPPGPAHRRHARACATSRCPTPGRPPRSPTGPAGRPRHRPRRGRRPVHPTMLIGTSTQAGAFTEAIVRDDGRARRPADHLAAVQPDLEGRGDARRPDRVDRRPGAHRHRQPVRARRPTTGVTYQIAQANNALVFPGLGLGVTVARAPRITDGMLAAAADAVAGLSDAAHAGRAAAAAGRRPARGLRRRRRRRRRGRRGRRPGPGRRSTNPVQQVHEAMWRPDYPRVETKPL